MATADLTSSAPPVCGRPLKAVMTMGWPSASALTRKFVPDTCARGVSARRVRAKRVGVTVPRALAEHAQPAS